MTLLFVYGSLRRDRHGRLHPRLGPDAEWHGHARWQGRLYRVAGYPGAVPSADRSESVHGELVALPRPDAVLAALDDWEDCAGPDPEYRRDRVSVLTDDGRRHDAWIYVYARPVDGLERIASGDYGPGGDVTAPLSCAAASCRGG